MANKASIRYPISRYVDIKDVLDDSSIEQRSILLSTQSIEFTHTKFGKLQTRVIQITNSSSLYRANYRLVENDLLTKYGFVFEPYQGILEPNQNLIINIQLN